MYTFNLHMAGSDSWMSVKEAATYLGKSAHWLYQNRERLQIPCSVIGGTLRFEKSRWMTGLEIFLKLASTKAQGGRQSQRFH